MGCWNIQLPTSSYQAVTNPGRPLQPGLWYLGSIQVVYSTSEPICSLAYSMSNFFHF